LKGSKLKAQSSKFLVYLLIAFCIFGGYYYKNAFADDISSANPLSINHPDKRVSNAAAVIADDGRIYIGWAKEEGNKNNIYVVASSDDGKTFSDKVRVNGNADMPSGINHAPSMALGTKGELYLAWIVGKTGSEFASDIKFSRSVDGGRTFEPAISINDDKVPASHGFESMAIAPDGTIYLAWLDGREKKDGGTSATYFARSIDSGKSFEKNVRIDGNSCPCCRTAVTAAPDGAVYVSWRKVFKPVPADSKQGGDVREIVAAKSSDKGISFSESSIVGNDNWVIAGCPHRGASLSVDKDGILYIVWYTEGGDGLPSIYIANSKDGGKTFFKTPLPYAKGAFPDHPVMALNKDGIPVLSWEETTPVLSRVMFQSVDEKPQQMNQGVRRAHDPVISVNKKGDILLAWTQDEMRFTKTVLRLSKGE
jgi:hypothetical protein